MSDPWCTLNVTTTIYRNGKHCNVHCGFRFFEERWKTYACSLFQKLLSRQDRCKECLQTEKQQYETLKESL